MGRPETVFEVITRANQGDREAAKTLAPWLDQHPEVWRHLGDQARQTQQQLLNLMSGENGLADQEATRRTMAAMQDELAGPTPSPLERLLIERIVLGWLHVFFLEQCVVGAMQQGARPESRPEVQLEFEMRRITANQKWLDRAHHRYLTALKALAQVRKLRLPGLQVNIAENQMNVRS